ncbi:uncharacterized protein LOC121048972 [Rosa chinensis]|uniref:uncharacterized protein LOC121048972 n=1 Tax=Rosa chinensis TaxID=74649 RepID=UPI001AD8C43E|nr:uncharacterized protein LOC121048972 [Rosa chinensis]
MLKGEIVGTRFLHVTLAFPYKAVKKPTNWSQRISAGNKIFQVSHFILFFSLRTLTSLPPSFSTRPQTRPPPPFSSSDPDPTVTSCSFLLLRLRNNEVEEQPHRDHRRVPIPGTISTSSIRNLHHRSISTRHGKSFFSPKIAPPNAEKAPSPNPNIQAGHDSAFATKPLFNLSKSPTSAAQNIPMKSEIDGSENPRPVLPCWILLCM